MKFMKQTPHGVVLLAKLCFLLAMLPLGTLRCASTAEEAPSDALEETAPDAEAEAETSEDLSATDDIAVVEDSMEAAETVEKDTAEIAEPAPQVPNTGEADNATHSFQTGVAGTPMDVGMPEAGTKMSYIVRKGDTLSGIAKNIYNDMKRWKELAQWSSFENPDRIYPGDVVYYQLDTQSLPFAKEYENLPKNEFIVQKASSLKEVAQIVLGSSDRWKEIWRFNFELKDPLHVPKGTTIYFLKTDMNKKMFIGMTSKSHDKGSRRVFLKS
jgi:hypothetical protein